MSPITHGSVAFGAAQHLAKDVAAIAKEVQRKGRSRTPRSANRKRSATPKPKKSAPKPRKSSLKPPRRVSRSRSRSRGNYSAPPPRSAWTSGYASKCRQISMFLADPRKSMPMRLGSTLPTGACILDNVVSVTFSSAATNTQIPVGSMLAFLSRHPSYPLIVYDPQPASGFKYQALFEPQPQFSSSPGGIPAAGTMLNNTAFTAPVTNMPNPIRLNPVFWTPNGSYQPHGPQYTAGFMNGRTGFWVDGLTTLSPYWCNIIYGIYSTSTGSSEVTLNVYISQDGSNWQPYPCVQQQNVPINSTINTGTLLNDPGYYAFEMNVGWSNPNNGTFAYLQVNSMTINTGTSGAVLNPTNGVFRHLPLPRLPVVMSSVQNVKVNAASLRIANNASVMGKNGTIYMAAVSTGESWYDFVRGGTPDVAITALSACHRKDSNYTGGGYMYLKPQDKSELGFLSKAAYPVNSAGGLQNSNLPLWLPGTFNVVYLSTVVVAGAPSSSSRLDCSFGIEFMSDVQWFQMGPTDVTENALSDCVYELSDRQQFFVDSPTAM